MSSKSYIIKMIVTALFTALALSFFEAYVLMFMWNRFVPIITGNTFIVINYWAAFGIMLIIDLFTVKIKSGSSNDGANQPAEVIGLGLSKALIDAILLGIAALVSLGI